MTLTSNTPARLRQLAPATLCPAVALAVMILTAPAAHALTELQIENQCKANGGTYTHYKSESGEEWSTCCYKKPNGKQDYCDYYFNGEYTTTVWGNATPPPVGQPAQPPPATAAPGAPVMPGQGPQPVQPPPATVAPVIP